MRTRLPTLVIALSILAFFVFPPQSRAQVLRFNRANSGFVDDFPTKIIFFQGLPLVCTESGLTIIHPDHLETWRRGENGLPDGGLSGAAIFMGKIWIGTNGKGLARLDEGKWRSFTTADSGLVDNFVTAIAVFGNRLYVGTREGLNLFDGFLWERSPLDSGKSIFVKTLTTDGTFLWVGTNRGIFKIGAGSLPTPVETGLSFPIRVTALHSQNGVLYAGYDGGVIAIKSDSQKIFWGTDRLPAGKIYDLVSMENGALCATSRGLYRLGLDGSLSMYDFRGTADSPTISVTALARGGGFFWMGLEGAGIVRLPEQLEGFLSLNTPVSPGQAAGIPGGSPGPNLAAGDIKILEVKNFFPGEGHPVPTSGPTPNPTGGQMPGRSSPTPQLFSPGNSSTSAPPGWSLETKPGQAGRATSPQTGFQAVQPAPSTRTQTAFTAPITPQQTQSGLPGGWVVEKPGKSPGPITTAPGQTSFLTPSPSDSTNLPGWQATSPGSQPGSPQKAPSTTFAAQPAQTSTGLPPGWGPSNPPAKPTLTFSGSIRPIIQRTCIGCHTTGPGNYFSLADTTNLIAYFRREGTRRLEQAIQPGRGMFGKAPQTELDTIKAWIADGAKE